MNNIRLIEWIEKIQALGRNAISLKEIKTKLPGTSATGLKPALNRLTSKGKIVSIHKGYCLIIPPQYTSKDILPPAIFLDPFMKFLILY